MNIACITITYNDYHSIEQWTDLYNQYKEAIAKHIIVDNNSDHEYFMKLKEKFPDSLILRRQSNGGTTAAFNTGINAAMNDPATDSILIIANDIQITTDDVEKTYQHLSQISQNIIISPILLKSDKTSIDMYGYCFDEKYRAYRPFNGLNIFNDLPEEYYADTTAGGLFMAKRSFFERFGMFDEGLFMYGEELDMFFRLRQMGYKALFISSATATHMHINPEGNKMRLGYTEYLMARNRIYLLRKHVRNYAALKAFWRQLKLLPRKTVAFVKAGKPQYIFHFIDGCFAGILNLENKYPKLKP